MDKYLSSITLSHDDVLYALERELYLKMNSNAYYLPIDCIKTKIVEFSQFINSIGRLSMLKCHEKSEDIVFLLLTLKKTIKSTLSELGQSPSNTNSYTCNECNESIDIDPKYNFWTCLQSHEHFENRYCKFLNGTLNTVPKSMAAIALEYDTVYKNDDDARKTSSLEVFYENTDSGIDNENCEGDTTQLTKLSEKEILLKEDINSFKFNFVLHYDDPIETKLYPESFMKAVRNADKIREHTIQRAGPYRAVCLLCSCDLVTRSKISKMVVMDHAMGQRHLRHASNPMNISALKNYHDVWLNFELSYQAHQVYFKPDTSSTLKCVVCNSVVNDRNVVLHIETDPHKTIVLELFVKSNNIYYLTHLQVQLYGVHMEQIETTNKEIKKESVDCTKMKTEKPRSDSSPSYETKDLKHNIIKSVTNESSLNILDLLPNRFKEHLSFLKNNGTMITCEICKVTLPKDIEKIKKHIQQSAHINTSKICLKKYSYFCDICNINIKDENAWVRHITEGPNKHANMAESRKKNTAEYECTKCCTVIYGDDLSLTRHLSVRLRRDKRSKEVKLPDSVKKLFKSKEVIENKGHTLTHEANDTLNYNQLTKECCIKLEETLRAVFEDCRVYPFGSRISGLGNKDSDLDVFIDTGEMYTGYKNQDAVAQIQLVRKATALFIKCKDEFQDVVPIPTARTPIVKLFHKKTEIECDLSFRHGLSVENTEFLKFCFKLQPIAQPLILLLKKWSEYNNLTEHISTYALAIMAIFYLQINNYLLSLKKLRELNPEESLIINGWRTIKYTMHMEQLRKYVEPYPYNVSKLLEGFFQYYAKFPYPSDVICPLIGCTIKKSQFYEDVSGDKLPEEMKSYITQLQSEEPERFRATSPICIQDPFDLSHNLTKACQIGTLNKFKILCDLSFDHLCSLK